jgi:hypothetical protein
LLQDIEELVERRRIEARGDADVAAIAEDQFERGRGREDLTIGRGHGDLGTDMDRQEGGGIALGRARGWRSDVSRPTWASRRESGTEAIEPVAERVDGDLAEVAELDVGQARATKVGEDGRPVDLTRRLSHEGTSRDRQADLILAWPRPTLKMRSTGRLRCTSNRDEKT